MPRNRIKSNTTFRLFNSAFYQTAAHIFQVRFDVGSGDDDWLSVIFHRIDGVDF
jgi:hypothetical protein